jgi:hypothetical protein
MVHHVVPDVARREHQRVPGAEVVIAISSACATP